MPALMVDRRRMCADWSGLRRELGRRFRGQGRRQEDDSLTAQRKIHSAISPTAWPERNDAGTPQSSCPSIVFRTEILYMAADRGRGKETLKHEVKTKGETCRGWTAALCSSTAVLKHSKTSLCHCKNLFLTMSSSPAVSVPHVSISYQRSLPSC